VRSQHRAQLAHLDRSRARHRRLGRSWGCGQFGAVLRALRYLPAGLVVSSFVVRHLAVLDYESRN